MPGDRVVVFDGHNDTLTHFFRQQPVQPAEFFNEHAGGHVDYPRARRGGLAGAMFAIYTGAPADSVERQPMWGVTFTERGYDQLLNSAIQPARATALTKDVIAFARQIEAASNGQVQIVTHSAQLADCLARDVLAMVLHIEGAEAINEDLSNLDEFYALGIRSIGLVWSRPNVFGCGVPFRFPHSPDTGPGLSPAGKALVQACNRLGILVDMAHLNEKGFWDVAAVSNAPLVVTHADVYAICNSTRNVTDDQIRAVAQSDGVVGINFEVIQTREDGTPNADTPITQLVKHIDYIAQHFGIDHVALGSDFDGADDMFGELEDVAGLPNLIQALRDQGYDQEAIEKVAFRNWRRVLRAAWKD